MYEIHLIRHGEPCHLPLKGKAFCSPVLYIIHMRILPMRYIYPNIRSPYQPSP